MTRAYSTLVVRLTCVIAALSPAVVGAATDVWRPAPGTTWQWQLTGTTDRSLDVAMYDVDLFGTTAETVSALHAQGRKAVCHMSAGTSENGRPDSHRFTNTVKGKNVGSGGEKWLDIRNIAVLGPIME